MRIPVSRVALAVTSVVMAASTLGAAPVSADIYGGFIVPGANNPAALNTNPNANVGVGTTFSGQTMTNGQTTTTTTVNGQTTTTTTTTPPGTATAKAGQSVNLLTATNVKATETMYQQDGQSLMSTITTPPHTNTQIQQSCNSHKQELLSKFADINGQLNTYQTRINTILTSIESYQKKNNVEVTNWDSLLLSATNAQAVSANAIAALKAVTPAIDCTKPGVGDDIAAYRSGAAEARNDLSAYLISVKAILKAVLGGNTVTSGTTKTPSPSPTAIPAPTKLPSPTPTMKVITGTHF